MFDNTFTLYFRSILYNIFVACADEGRQISFVWSKPPTDQMRPLTSSAWGGSSDKLSQMKESWIKSTKAGGVDGQQLQMSNSKLSSPFSTLCHDVDRLMPLKGKVAKVLKQGDIFLLG